MISIRDVHKSYGSVEVLRGCSVEVSKGEVMVVCAGNRGAPSLEDAACAGLLCEGLARRGAAVEGGAARLARSLAARDPAEVQAVVQGSAHARELRALAGAVWAAPRRHSARRTNCCPPWYWRDPR